MLKLLAPLSAPPKEQEAQTLNEATYPHIDYDYTHRLNKDDKQFLFKFTREYYFNQIYRDKALHQEKRLQLDVYSRENSRRRCVILTKNTIPYVDNISTRSPEDALIEMIDRSRGHKD